ncbi:hypothetical protein CUJ84_pRLN2000338 (plasmid) [Rhizobium leguminosarum]|uniref:Uncharacterized protein n=1 Tax=Rhizobium leguminosarum TaxID=384 RepID=A0A2K9ZF61_RHILE|nr:hypothetical protein CUJ84_pRLN2000338 [Rhizobium leguminosarum]
MGRPVQDGVNRARQWRRVTLDNSEVDFVADCKLRPFGGGDWEYTFFVSRG